MARSRRTPAMLVGRCSSELSSHKLQAKSKKSQAPCVHGFPVSPLSAAPLMWVLPKENHMHLTEAATLDRKSGEAEGSAVPRTLPGNVFDRAHRSGEPAPACRGIRSFFSVLSHPLRVTQDVSPGSALKA